MNAHTVTVTFDEKKSSLAAIETALNDAGYVVKGSKQLE